MKFLWGLLLCLGSIIFLGAKASSASAAQGESCVQITSRYDPEVHTVIDLDTGAARSYVEPPLLGTPVEFPSPDGRYVAYARPDSVGTARLTLTDTTTGQTQTIAEQVERKIAWSPDSRLFAYIQSYPERRGVDAFELVVADAVNGDHRAVIVQGTGYDSPLFSWSADGSKIATTAVTGDEASAQIFSMPSLEVLDSLHIGTNNPNITWSPSGQSIVFAGNNFELAFYSLETKTLQPMDSPEDGYYPTVAFSPDESFILTHFAYSDHNAEFNVFNRSGEIVWNGMVSGADSPSYDWVSGHQLIVSAWTNLGIDDAVLIDLTNGEERIVHKMILGWSLSPDGRHLAVLPYRSSPQPSPTRYLHVYDLTRLDLSLPLLVSIDKEPAGYTWSADSAELLVLNQERVLRGFTYATGAWREIASLPDGYGMHRTPCYPPELTAQTCTLFGGFADEPARWFFDVGEALEIPVQMPTPRPSLQSGDGQYTLSREAMPEDLEPYTLYSLSVHDSLIGETRVIADHVDSQGIVWAPISNRFVFLQVSSSDEQIDGYTLNIMSPKAEAPSTIHIPAEEHDLRLIGAGVAWSPDEEMIAVAYGYHPTQVKIFAVYDQREIVTFEVQEGQTELLWSPTASYLTAIDPVSSLDTMSLYIMERSPYATDPPTVITIQSDYRSYRRLSWSPDESYLVEYGTYGDFSAAMSIFTAAGEPLITDLQVNSADDGGSAIYGWLDDHTLIAGLDFSTQELSQIDVLTGAILPLEGAALDIIPCKG